MKILAYKSSDLPQIITLFNQTIEHINAQHYTQKQIKVWANSTPDLEKWHQSLSSNHTLIAWNQQQIIGFADITPQGYLDRLYVHKSYQRQGIAKKLYVEIERRCNEEFITTHSSITALPFFRAMGFKEIKQQTVIKDGQCLINYLMQKDLTNNKTIL